MGRKIRDNLKTELHKDQRAIVAMSFCSRLIFKREQKTMIAFQYKHRHLYQRHYHAFFETTVKTGVCFPAASDTCFQCIHLGVFDQTVPETVYLPLQSMYSY